MDYEEADANALRKFHTQKGTTMPEIKYPNIEVQLTGRDGNAFAVMGAVKKALKKANVPASEITAYLDESMSGDYDNLLATAMRWVDVS